MLRASLQSSYSDAWCSGQSDGLASRIHAIESHPRLIYSFLIKKTLMLVSNMTIIFY